MKVELDDILCVKDTSITVRGSRRRITVPAEIVEVLKLKNGDKLRWVLSRQGEVNLQKVK